MRPEEVDHVEQAATQSQAMIANPRQPRSASSAPGVILRKPITNASEPYTVLILGVPRGGTTMVAGIAQRLGLEIGQNLDYNLEDPDFCMKPVEHMVQAIADRNNRLKVWGWKFPAATNYIADIELHLRNLRVVSVWRDPLSAAMRRMSTIERKAGQPEAAARGKLNVLARMAEKQMSNIEFLSASGVPAYLVSYEKAVRAPEAFIGQLAEFIGFPPPDDLSELVNFMEPGAYKPG